MRNAKYERELRRAVLELSKHGNEDVSDILGRLNVAQRDKLRDLLDELGGVKEHITITPSPTSPPQPSMDPAIRAFLRRMPSSLAERFQASLTAKGHPSGNPPAFSAIKDEMPRHMTERTASALANAIIDRARVSAFSSGATAHTQWRSPLFRWPAARDKA
jgi:hypothetical protein